MLPDLDSLSLFVLAAECGSLTKAADASCISLGAASRRIALLEERFNASLLERSSRGVVVTAAGAALLAQAKRVLLDVNQLRSEMADHSQGSKGLIRMLANTSAITSYLPRDLSGFNAAHPELRLSLGEAWSDEIVRAVTDHRADVGIIVLGHQAHSLNTRPYRSYQIAAVLPPGHPLGHMSAVPFVDVLQYEIIALESSSSMMRSLQEQALLVQHPIRLRVQVRSFEAVCRLVQAGLGVGLLPEEAAIAFAEEMGLSVLPLTDAWATRAMVICFRRDSEKSRSVAAVIDHLEACAAPFNKAPSALP